MISLNRSHSVFLLPICLLHWYLREPSLDHRQFEEPGSEPIDFYSSKTVVLPQSSRVTDRRSLPFRHLEQT